MSLACGDGPSTSTTTRPHRTRRPSYKLRENGKSVSDPQRAVLWRQRRATRVVVLVPTLRQINRLRHANQNEDRPAQTPLKTEEQEPEFHFLLKARIKSEVKREDVSFENVVRDRLARMGPETVDLDVPEPLLQATATRMFMSRTWGGRPSDMFPQAGKNFTHGLDDFMYVNPKYDPHVPRWPGAPGLFFTFGGHDEGWPKIMRVVVRVESHAWKYMGQYTLTAAPPLTADEWNTQSDQAKRSWAEQLSERETDDAKRLRAEIVLRTHLGREPTSQEIATVTSIRSRKKIEASPDDILRRCNEGSVVVRVWYMKCVGYDLDFQRRIAAGSRNSRT